MNVETYSAAAPILDVAQIAALIPDGCKLAVPKDYSGVAMSITRALIARGARELHVVCVPIGGLQADMLIGAGCVRVIETSAVTLGEYGAAPCFTHAIKRGSLHILDATCPAIYAGLQATEKGIPFLPLRGLIGSDILRHRPDWHVIANPYQAGDELVAIAAIRPDVALFQAPLADRNGNVFIGTQRELMLMAHAAAQTFVSVEEITDNDLLSDPARAGAVIASTYINAIALSPRGAQPLALPGYYDEDQRFLLDYAGKMHTAENLRALCRSN